MAKTRNFGISFCKIVNMSKNRVNKDSPQSSASSSRSISEESQIPIPESTDSYVVLSSGEILPVVSQFLNNDRENPEGGNDVNDIENNNPNINEHLEIDESEETDSPSEDEDIEGNFLDEIVGNENDIPNDEPSTSTGIRRTDISDAVIASLRSTETADLLADLKKAYGNKGKPKKVRISRRISRRHFNAPADDSDSDSQIDEEYDEEIEDQEIYDDDADEPMDQEYFPSKKIQKKENAKRRARSLSAQTRAPNRNPRIVDMSVISNWMTDDTTGDEDANQCKKSSHSRKNLIARFERGTLSAWSDTDMDDGQPKKRRVQKLPPEVESLLGQSIVSFAQGRREEAVQMVEEVVKTHPECYESYERLSMFYAEMGDKRKQLHFGILAAYLNSGCDAYQWGELADLALQLGENEQAIGCYTKAYLAKPTVREYYEAKITLLLKHLETIAADNEAARKTVLKKISNTRIAAVKGTLRNTESMSTEEYVEMATRMFQGFYEIHDVRGSILCLKCILERGKMDDNRVMYDYLNNFMDVSIHSKDYEDALLALFRYSKLLAFNTEGVLEFNKTTFEESLKHHRQSLPFTGEGSEKLFITHYTVPEGFPVDLMGKAVACWTRLQRYDCCKPLLEMLQTEVAVQAAPDIYWEIAQALADMTYFAEAEKILDELVRMADYEDNSNVWLCYAEALSFQGNLEAASAAFARVVQLSPHHVGARLNLSALQQQLGQMEEALQTLDIGDGRLVAPEHMDERLLYQRCVLLRQQENWQQFIRTARYLMTMHFKDVNWNVPWSTSLGVKYDGYRISQTLRAVVLDALRNTNWERVVQRIPRAESGAVPHDELWNIFFELCELMYDRRMFTDFFYICCMASQSPLFLRGNRIRTVLQLLVYSAMLKRNSRIAWTVLRYCMPTENSNRLWNVYGILFVFHQEIRYHRFTLRAMLKTPENIALAWFSGNNSLITGTYQHALAEYFYILQRRPNDPLLNMLIGISFIHLAVKKFIARRHDLFVQGLAFLNKYEELRGSCQEVYYNMGRAFQQAGIFYAAVHYYRKALALDPVPATDGDKHKGVGKNMYDLRPLIAHNLALIYQHSNNALMARELLETYCTVE